MKFIIWTTVSNNSVEQQNSLKEISEASRQALCDKVGRAFGSLSGSLKSLSRVAFNLKWSEVNSLSQSGQKLSYQTQLRNLSHNS